MMTGVPLYAMLTKTVEYMYILSGRLRTCREMLRPSLLEFSVQRSS